MTVGALRDVLNQIIARHGGALPVLVVDDRMEWPFSVHVENEVLEDGAGHVVYLDLTGEPDEVRIDPED